DSLVIAELQLPISFKRGFTLIVVFVLRYFGFNFSHPDLCVSLTNLTRILRSESCPSAIALSLFCAAWTFSYLTSPQTQANNQASQTSVPNEDLRIPLTRH